MDKHSALSHYVRPDAVHITSVLQPFANINPVADSMAVSASFVNPGGGLAGSTAQIHFLGRRSLRGAGVAPKTTFGQHWANFKARLRVNMTANRYMRDMRFPAAAGSPQVTTVDTSPRPPNADMTAIAVTGGWAPSPQSRASEARYVPMQGDPPNQGPAITAVAMAPAEAAFPQGFWNRVIRDGYPPIVAARAQEDVLTKWFGVKSPTGAGY